MIDTPNNITATAEQSPIETSLTAIRADLWHFLIDHPDCVNSNARSILTFRDVEKINTFIADFNTWLQTVPQKLWIDEHLNRVISEIDTITALFNSQAEEEPVAKEPEVSCAGLFAIIADELEKITIKHPCFTCDNSIGVPIVVRDLPRTLIDTIYKDIFTIMRAAGLVIEEKDTGKKSNMGSVWTVRFAVGEESVDFEQYATKFAAEQKILQNLRSHTERQIRACVDAHLAKMPHCVMVLEHMELGQVEKILEPYKTKGYKIENRTDESTDTKKTLLIYK
jgi:hypothetical protein